VRVLVLAAALAALSTPSGARAQEPAGSAPTPSASQSPGGFEPALAAAEASLRKGDSDAAGREYREAVFEGWLLLASLERLDGRLAQARQALEKAAERRVASQRGVRALAMAQLRCGEAAKAAGVLGELADEDPRDAETRRLLSMVLSAQGRYDEARKRLDEAWAARPDDPELVFLIGSEYLWLKKPDVARELFAEVARARPIPQTHVLLGRAYRDAGEYARARTELAKALEMDPTVRRAHYYLGMVALAEGGTSPDRFDRARVEFEKELKGAPDDALTRDQLGLVLLEAGHPEKALPELQAAVKADERAQYLAHLARAQLALDSPKEAADSARRGLERVGPGDAEEDVEALHFQLGRALRLIGQPKEAAEHLAEAGRLAAHRASAPKSDDAARGHALGTDPVAALTPEQRAEAKKRLLAGLARAYFNLGVLEAQRSTPAAERFARAADLFESAAEVDPDFPAVQSSLGIARFNARQFDQATAPLQRALEQTPHEPGLERMLATAWLNTGVYDKAVTLLQDDPERSSNPAVGFAYGLALLRSGRAAEAATELEAVVQLVPNDPDVHFGLGQAYEKLGRSEQAREQFDTARRLRPRP
jgi:tetratricopeptide (TPR) repeat protein